MGNLFSGWYSGNDQVKQEDNIQIAGNNNNILIEHSNRIQRIEIGVGILIVIFLLAFFVFLFYKLCKLSRQNKILRSQQTVIRGL